MRVSHEGTSVPLVGLVPPPPALLLPLGDGQVLLLALIDPEVPGAAQAGAPLGDLGVWEVD